MEHTPPAETQTSDEMYGRTTNVQVRPLTIALDQVPQRTRRQPTMTPGHQQRRLTGHRETAQPIERHQVQHRLTRRRIERDLTGPPALTDHLDPLPRRTVTFDYDAFGNPVSVLVPLGHEVTREYDGNDRLVKVTDALGQYVDFNYTDGRLTSIEAPNNAGSSSNRRTNQLFYDDANRLTRVNGEIGSSTFQKRVGYQYDGFSQLKALERLQGGLDKLLQLTDRDCRRRLKGGK